MSLLDRLALTARLLPALPKLTAHKPDDRTSVADLVEAQARRRPVQPFLHYGDREQSYGELNRAANQVAHWARGRGLARGDVVVLCMENRPEYVCTWAGLAKLGVTAALINTHLAGRALGHAIATSKARHVIVGEECLPRYAGAAADLPPDLELWIARDREAPPGDWPGGAQGLDAALAQQSEENPDASLREGLHSGDDLFYIYTSGTTGLPKAARFSHMRFLGMGDIAAYALSLRPGDVHYCALPLYHSAGGAMLVSSVLSAGAAMALRRRFSATRFWDDVRRHRATCFQYIGELCRYLLQQPPRPDDREHPVRAMIGNGLRADVWSAFQERFAIPVVREFYGATEGNAAIMNFENKVGSVGRFPWKVFSNARIIRYDHDADTPVRGPDGLCIECGEDEVGELVGRLPKRANDPAGRFEGYTSKEATERKLLRDVFARGDVWFRSGDLLRRDRDDFFYFVDRIGDTFRWKGENVSTQEVAEQLGAFPGLFLVNVYGVAVPGADGRAGMAALVLEPGARFDAAAFYLHARALPRYAAPLFVRLLAEQETTGTFKIRKVDLQREGFDPASISDPLFVRDDAASAYVPLTREIADEIAAGRRAL
ncbi:MAG TPA: long-chain-acyl-CoA synthetase [Myxococcota bacterium]|nr:long-chain-acyl-CoA synthetase [Myxococcota bacterium]